jgi:hypothetical protein
MDIDWAGAVFPIAARDLLGCYHFLIIIFPWVAAVKLSGLSRHRLFASKNRFERYITSRYFATKDCS